jgi:hypothetical protein
MNGSAEQAVPFQILRVLVVLLVWGIWLLFSGVWSALVWAWELLCSRWSRRILFAGIGAGVLGCVIQLAPLLYGRFALLHAVAHQARTSQGKETDDIVMILRRTAFENGFKDVIHQDSAFTVEHSSDDDGTSLCAITVDLEQKVHLLTKIPISFRVKKRVVSVVIPADLKPKSLEDRIIVD